MAQHLRAVCLLCVVTLIACGPPSPPDGVGGGGGGGISGVGGDGGDGGGQAGGAGGGGMGGGSGAGGGGSTVVVMSFAADVMPVLRAKCTGCHNGVYDNAATTLSRLRATTGAVGACANTPRMVINNGSESLLVKKLLGTASCGLVMPLIRNSPTETVPCSGTQCVAAADIDKVKVWIDQGALDN